MYLIYKIVVRRLSQVLVFKYIKQLASNKHSYTSPRAVNRHSAEFPGNRGQQPKQPDRKASSDLSQLRLHRLADDPIFMLIKSIKPRVKIITGLGKMFMFYAGNGDLLTLRKTVFSFPSGKQGIGERQDGRRMLIEASSSVCSVLN